MKDLTLTWLGRPPNVRPKLALESIPLRPGESIRLACTNLSPEGFVTLELFLRAVLDYEQPPSTTSVGEHTTRVVFQEHRRFDSPLPDICELAVQLPVDVPTSSDNYKWTGTCRWEVGLRLIQDGRLPVMGVSTITVADDV